MEAGLVQVGRGGVLRAMIDGVSGAGLSMARAVLLAAGIVLSASAVAAPATPAPQRAAAAETAKQIEEAPEASADAANCTTARRRLWVEGEGWIVRRITSCH